MLRRSSLCASIALSLGIARRAAACAEHAQGHPLGLSRVLWWWSWDPLGVLILVLSAAVYMFGLWRLWRHAGLGHGVRAWQALAFGGGWFALAVALISPIDSLSDILFSAHMSQHELLMLVAAPLMVLGRPWLTFLWALPHGVRHAVLGWSHLKSTQRIWRLASAPWLILALHGFVLWLWHIPALFQAALLNETVHAVQHASFFFTAALFFWTLLDGRYGRIGYGVSTCFVFVTAAHTGLLGALLTVAGRLWYPLHQQRGLAYGVCALEDQQLAGLIMWIPAGAILTVMGLAFFAAWLGEAERRVRLAERLDRR